MLDHIQEVAPAGGRVFRVLHLLCAEIEHREQVVREFLLLEGWDGNVGQVDDEVVPDHLVVAHVTLELLDMGQHLLD